MTPQAAPRRFFGRLLQAAPVVMALAMIGIGILFSLNLDRLHQGHRLGELTAQARILAGTASAALAFGDRPAAQEYVEALRMDPEIAAAGIYDNSGRLFAGYARWGVRLPAVFNGNITARTPGVLCITAEVTQENTLLGHVLLKTHAETLFVRVQRFGPVALLVVMAGLMVGMLGLSQSALRRVNTNLAAQARELADVNRQLREQMAQRELAEAALRQAQKMEAVGQLTGGLAHDFNNLLTGISGSLELLKKRMAQGRVQDVARYLETAMASSKRAASLTQRLLAFSRRQTLDPKPTHIPGLVMGMEELIRRTVGPMVEIRLVGMEGGWNTRVDPNQLENALLNLCINARDAMPQGGRIIIKIEGKTLAISEAAAQELQPGEYVLLSIADNGVGMPPEVVQRAFDPFFTTKPLGEGTGLGLSMVYGFARQSGGNVHIISAPEVGTTICLYLPRYQGEMDAAHAAARPEPPALVKDKTVLIVDDEPAVRMLVAETLQELGYGCLHAEDAKAGLAVLEAARAVDLLVTDVGLPGGMNGRQLADAARLKRPDLRVLFITGYAENTILRGNAMESGMGILTKPFTLDTLASRITEMIQA